MKKILLIALVAVLWFSCSKKNDSQSSIVGKWYEITYSTTVDTNGTFEYNSIATYNHTQFKVFNSDGTGFSVSRDSLTTVTIDTFKFTYTLSGKTLKIKLLPYVTMGDSVVSGVDSSTISILTNSQLETQLHQTTIATYVPTNTITVYNYFVQTDYTK